MEDPQKTSRVSVDDEDRISNLPESVICHILSFLPTKTSVATSVLSKSWESLWTKVTSLDFTLCKDDDFDVSLVENDDHYEESEVQKVRELVQTVNKALLNMDSQRMQVFRLNWWQGSRHEPENIPTWITYAIGRSFRELIITTNSLSVFDFHLPPALFTCATLELLILCVHMVMKVPSSVRLPKLKYLDLGTLLYESNECIPKLISGCPELETLRIARDSNDTMRDFRVSSPSLTCFNFIRVCKGLNTPFDGKLELDAPNLKWFSLDEVLRECKLIKRLTSLHSGRLDLDHDELPHGDGLYAACCNSTVKLVEAMHNVEFLRLEGAIIKALGNTTTTLSVCFERLLELKISIQCCDWDSLGDILGRSTKLQVLDITKVGCGKNATDDHRLCWNDPTKVPECLLSSLIEVSFVNFEGLEDEMAMVKYILQHGEVLESFTLKSEDADSGDYKNKFQLLQRVSMFPRCSCDCRIQFE